MSLGRPFVPPSVESPCVRNCCLDDDNVCIGCGRELARSSPGARPATKRSARSLRAAANAFEHASSADAPARFQPGGVARSTFSAAQIHVVDAPRVLDVLEWIRVEHDEVGALAGRDRSCVREPHELSAIARGRHDDVGRRHAGGDHVLHLEVRSPRHVAVGAERESHARRGEPSEVACLDRVRGLRFADDPWRRPAASGIARRVCCRAASSGRPRRRDPGDSGRPRRWGAGGNSVITSSSTSTSRMP